MNYVPDVDKHGVQKPYPLKFFDIKEDGFGEGKNSTNYKTRAYDKLGAWTCWRKRQVLNLPSSDYSPELLTYLALQPYIYDKFRGTASYSQRQLYTKDIVDYPKWKEENWNFLTRD